MSVVRWRSKPEPARAVLVAAFEGWNDAADAATTAVQYLNRAWEAEPFGDIDPEQFYDFTALRPQVRLADGSTREIQWPENNLSVATIGERSVVLLDGTEPHLRWRLFCDSVIEMAQRLNVEMVVMLGALIADVAHTKPVPVTATADDPEVAASLNLRHSRYEGPTGIVGVLHEAFAAGGIGSASLWAAVPHYVSHNPSPRAALALIERTLTLLDLSADLTELELAAAEYDRQVDDVVEGDPEAAAYVRSLEETDVEVDDDIEDFSHESLVAEAEDFLRTQTDEDDNGSPST